MSTHVEIYVYCEIFSIWIVDIILTGAERALPKDLFHHAICLPEYKLNIHFCIQYIIFQSYIFIFTFYKFISHLLYIYSFPPLIDLFVKYIIFKGYIFMFSSTFVYKNTHFFIIYIYLDSSNKFIFHSTCSLFHSNYSFFHKIQFFV